MKKTKKLEIKLVGGGREPENPMNPINRTDDRKKRTRERNRYSEGDGISGCCGNL